MSSDFDLLNWRGARTMRFPVAYDSAPRENEPLPWGEIKPLLLRLGAHQGRWPDCLSLEIAPGYSLQFEASRDREHPEQYAWMEIQCHAPWTFVLDLFREARAIAPDLVLFHPQTGLFHDPDSFAPLASAPRK